MKLFRPRFARILALAFALGGFALVSRRARAATATPPPPSVDDVGPLPCQPGVIRPRAAATPSAAVRPSALIDEQEREVAETRKRADEFERAADEIVKEAWRKEREAVLKKFGARERPILEHERVERDAAIDEFKAYLARRGQTPESAEATYRLAELQFERAQDSFSIAHTAWEARRDDATPGAPEPGAEPRPNYTDAVATWRTLVRRWGQGGGPGAPGRTQGQAAGSPKGDQGRGDPGASRTDGALYMIAYCLGEMGDARGSRDTFEELAKGDPKSAYAAEAWVRVGEFHFARAEYWPAIDAYGRATNFPDAPFYDKALYKLAWSWYRLADKSHPDAWENSARTFGRLLDAAPSSSLRGEALQYLALVYADHGGLKAVRDATDGKSWGAEVFPALAEVWFEEGAWKDASEAFRIALDERGDADAAPAWMNRRVLCALRLNSPADAADLREKLHFQYGVGSKWAASHAARPAVASSGAALAEAALLQAAVWRHQQAQILGMETDYARAADLYGEYLLRYPGRPAAYDITFYRAECLYYARHFAEAADAYGEVLQFTTDDRYHAEAAFSRVKAREKLLRFFPAPNIDPVPEVAAAAMPVESRAYAAAADEMVCVAPTDWRLPEVLFRGAEVYYGSRRLAAARSRAEAVVASAPGEDFAAHAAMLVVDAWRLEGNWGTVEATALRYAGQDLGRTEGLKDATRKSFARIALDAGFRVALELDAKGDYEKAASKFLAVAEASPKSELAPRALFGAADSLEKAGRGRVAGETFGRVSRQYPSSPLAMPAMFRHARAHERVLLVGQATAAYEDYLKKYPGGPDGRAAAWNVAVLLEAAGRDADAAQAWERFAQKFPHEDDTVTANMRAGDSWARAGKADKALKTWKALIQATTFDGAKNVIAIAGLARAERAAHLSSDNDTRHALEAQAILLAHGQSTPESARAAARVGLAKAADLRKSFDEVKITLPEAKLKSGLRVKRDVLSQLEETLLSVAAAGDADAATEALYKIGDAYAAYAKAIRDAPIPARKPVERDAWKDQMEATAEPLQDKAAAAFARELDLATTAGISTDWTRKTRVSLAALVPGARDPREDSIPFPAADVWALPAPVPIPGTQLADASGATAPPQRAREIAEALDAFARARDRGDRAGATAALARVDAVVPLAGQDAALAAAAGLDAALDHIALDDDAGAAAILQKALEAAPADAKLVAAYVAAVAEKGDPEAAISAAGEWLTKHPTDAAVRANLAGARMLLGQFAAALDAEVDALSMNTRLFSARRGAMSCAVALHRPELSVYIARQAIEDEPDNPRAVEALGLALRHSGDERVYGRAAGREILLGGTTRFPDDARLAHAAGAALLQDGDAKRALPLLERAAPHEMTAAAWTALAAARRGNGDAPFAAQAADEALAMSPDDPGALKNRGLAAFDAGDYAAAEKSFRRYLDKSGAGAGDPVQHWLDEAVAAGKKGGTP